MRVLRKSVSGFVSAAIIIQGLALSGCVTTGTTGASWRNDTSDVCYAQRVALDDTGNLFTKDVMDDVLAIGAGALLGVGVAVLTGNTSAASKVTGAVIGGLSGGLFAQLMEKQGRDGALTNLISSAGTEKKNLKATQVAMDNLAACRRKEIQPIKADYRAKRINRQEATDRLAVIRAKMEQDYEIARGVNAQVQKRGADYRLAANEAGSKGKKERQLASETASVLTVGQGVESSTKQLAGLQAEASMEEISLRPGFWAALFG